MKALYTVGNAGGGEGGDHCTLLVMLGMERGESTVHCYIIMLGMESGESTGHC